MQIFLILKKKKETLPWPHIPSYYFLFTAEFFKNFSILPIATSSRPFPPWSTEIHLSSCHFSDTALIESIGTFFYLTHQAWADLTAPEHLRPSWSRTAPSYALGASPSAGFLLLNTNFSLGFYPGFLLLTTPPHPSPPRGVRVLGLHPFTSSLLTEHILAGWLNGFTCHLGAHDFKVNIFNQNLHPRSRSCYLTAYWDTL